MEATTNGKAERVANEIAHLNATLTRLGFARGHGLTYGGDRDIYAVGGYPHEPQFANFWKAYQRDGIAKRVVDMVAETTWRTPPEIAQEGQPDGTPFTEAVMDLTERLGLWSQMEKADTLARIGRYSVLLIGAADGDDMALQNELPRLGSPDAVLYVQAYHEDNAQIAEWVSDPTDPRFGLPLRYRLQLGGDVAGMMLRGTSNPLVHWSRLIHVAENPIADRVYGTPALKAIWNDMLDFQKIRTSTAEAFWQRVAGILTLNVDKDTKLGDGELDAIDDALKEVYHDLRRTMLMKGGELKRLSESEPDPTGAAKLAMQCIASGSGYPMRMLFGSETGERSSTEDQKSYLGTVAERQQHHAEPVLVRPFLERLIERGALPKPGRDGFQVVWPPLFRESEKDMAEANKARADAARILTPVGGDPLALVEIDQERNVWLVPREAGEASPFDLPEPEEEVGVERDEGEAPGQEEGEEERR